MFLKGLSYQMFICFVTKPVLKSYTRFHSEFFSGTSLCISGSQRWAAPLLWVSELFLVGHQTFLITYVQTQKVNYYQPHKHREATKQVNFHSIKGLKKKTKKFKRGMAGLKNVLSTSRQLSLQPKEEKLPRDIKF